MLILRKEEKEEAVKRDIIELENKSDIKRKRSQNENKKQNKRKVV